MALLFHAVVLLAILIQPVLVNGYDLDTSEFVGIESTNQGKATAVPDEWIVAKAMSSLLSITPSLATTSMFLSLSCLVHRMQSSNALSFTRNHRSEMGSMCALLLPSVGLLTMLQGVDGYAQSAPKFVGTGASGNAYQGGSTAISGDGRTACIGGNGDSLGVGAVWIWTLSDPLNYSSWVQQGSKLVPNDNNGFALFGITSSLNFDGSIVIIGGYGDSNYLGATWMFTRNSTGWYQQGNKYVGIPYGNEVDSNVWQGGSVSIAHVAANTFVVGGPYDNYSTGAFWIFSKSVSEWTQNGGKMVGSGVIRPAYQGGAVTISSDATTIAVGANYQNSGVGAVWIFTLNVLLYYQQQGSMITVISSSYLFFGWCVALCADGNTLAIGAPQGGAMFFFTRTGGAWTQLGVKRVGRGHMGNSISICANGDVISVGGGIDNDIGAVWVWVRNSTCPSYCQYGDILVGSGYSGSSSQGAMNSLSISSDASILLIGGSTDNDGTGAWWAFNDTTIPLAPCARPLDTLSLSFSNTCTSPIISGTTCTPICIHDPINLAANPLLCYNGTLNPPASTCYAIPSISNLCPNTIIANISETILVQGSGFGLVNNTDLTCVFNYGFIIVPAIYYSNTAIECTVTWPDGTPNQFVQLNIANNSIVGTRQQSLPFTVLGACEASKPGSIPTSAGCVCDIGAYDTGTACQLCADGFYQEEQGQNSCDVCGSNQNTNGNIGSVSSTSCVCQVNYFPNPDYNSALNSSKCLECVVGMLCIGNNGVLILAGYWRANNNTIHVLSCPGGTAACKGTIPDSDTLCNDAYEGPLCSVCVDGFTDFGGECITCPDSKWNIAVLLLFLFIATAGFYGFVQLSKPSDGSSFKGLHDVKPIVKIAFNYLQVLYYIGRLSANWDSISLTFFSIIGQSTLTANFFSLQCSVKWSFYTRLLFVYLTPLIFPSLLFVVYAIRYFLRSKTAKQSFDDWQSTTMMLLYLIHPTILIEVVSSIPCDSVAGTGTSYLRADMSIDCSSDDYHTHEAISWLYMIFYILGALVALSYRGLYHNAQTGKLFDPSHPACKKYAFFVQGFKRESYFWEVVVMARKLAIAALSVLLSETLQLTWAMVFLFVSLLYNLLLQPFSDEYINRLESINLIILLCTVVIGQHFIAISDPGLTPTVLVIVINGVWFLFLLALFAVRFQKWLASVSIVDLLMAAIGRQRNTDRRKSSASVNNNALGSNESDNCASEKESELRFSRSMNKPLLTDPQNNTGVV